MPFIAIYALLAVSAVAMLAALVAAIRRKWRLALSLAALATVLAAAAVNSMRGFSLMGH